MAIQISIIGLGQIGGSVGLALASQKELIRRVGHDLVPAVAKRARDLGAVDKAEFNLHSAVEGAELILLTLPMDQIRETLEHIAEDLKEGAVVMDTGPVKEVVATWVSELLPKGRHYVGLTPVINPTYLQSHDTGIEAARADLFQGGLMAISSPPGTDSGAIKLAADLTRLIGSTAMFADTAEMDGLMAYTQILPQLLAAALLNATTDQPGWREARKVAGRAYAEATNPITLINSPQSLQSSAIENRENVVRMIDTTMAALYAIRNDIADQDRQSLLERLERARQGHDLWWKQRQSGDWVSMDYSSREDLPSSGDIFKNMFGIRRKPKDKS